MIRKFTKLMAALALLTLLVPLTGWGQTRTETIVYTLDGTQTGGSNGYATESDITQNSIAWKVTANTTTNPWRFGGKNLSGVDRPAYTTSALTSNNTNITKVVVTTGTANVTSVNSVKLIVADNANFTNATTLTENWVASSTITFNRPSSDNWTDKYFKIVYNITVSGNDNKYAQFVKAEFYAETGGGSQLTQSNLTITNQSTALTFDLYNNSNAQVINYTTSSTGAISINPPSPTSYFSYVHDATNKTITVTPIAVTPSAQTVTISQEADATYDAGSVSFTVSVANSAPLANIAALTANTTAGTYNVALSNAVVTYVNDNYAYIQDASGAVVYYKSGHGLTAGDVLTGTATVAYQLRNSNPQITDLTGVTPVSGTAPSPVRVAQSAWNYTFNDVLSQYFQVTGATITQSNNKYYVSLNNESIQLYKVGTAISGLDLTKTYTITGFPMLYNSTKELQIFVDPQNESTDPVINANDVTLPYDATSGEIAYTITNPATGVNPTATLQSGVNWITNLAVDANNNKVTFTTTANEGNADRQATITLIYTGATNKVVTVTQQHYVADYAALPFSFDGGSGDIANTAGLTASGLGSDYDYSPKLKFNDTDDYLILKINERPGTLTFDIKGNSFNGSTFKVQTSVDGQTYTDLETYSSLTTTLQNESFDNLGANVRYIKWVYTNKDNGNVALGNIALAAYVAPQPSITVASATVNATSAGVPEGTLDITYANLQISNMTDFGIQFYDANNNELNGPSEPDWVEVLVAEQDPQIGEGYVVSYTIDANEGPARTAYFKVFAMGDNDFVYSNLVTVNQAAVCAPAPTTGGWVLTNLADLAAGDVFVIVGYDEDSYVSYAMTNDNGTSAAPAPVVVTVSGNVLTGTIANNIKWNVSGDATNGYTFYPDGDDETWLYCTTNSSSGSNNNIRVGTGNRNLFVLDGNYLKTKDEYTARYLSLYYDSNNQQMQDWRGYTGTSSCPEMRFYKYVNVATETLTIQPYSGDGGYYLIASPFNGVEPTVANGFLTNSYDLYSFDQAKEEEWRNYETTPFYLLSGKGYLYASATATTLTFTGVPYNGNGQVALTYDANADLPGWNLIGNPFPATAYLSGSRSFYEMKADGTEIIANLDDEIAAMEGIFVVAADGNDNSVTFTTTAPAQTESIVLNVSRNRNEAIDRAIVRFGEGGQLPKFQLNPNNTKIYITEGNQDYAIVRSSSEAEVPVSFRASENGSYTISVDAENMEMTYLHLIDNMTGADVDLLATPSYTFEAKTTDYASRFRLVFSAEENGASTGSATFAFFNGSEWTISNIGEATLQVVDVMGRILSTETVNGNATISLNQVPGVYMLRLVNGNNVRTQKVVVR